MSEEKKQVSKAELKQMLLNLVDNNDFPDCADLIKDKINELSSQEEERYYLIKKTCLWFIIGDKVPFDKLQSKFTALGIRELLADGYIEIIFNK